MIFLLYYEMKQMKIKILKLLKKLKKKQEKKIINAKKSIMIRMKKIILIIYMKYQSKNKVYILKYIKKVEIK